MVNWWLTTAILFEVTWNELLSQYPVASSSPVNNRRAPALCSVQGCWRGCVLPSSDSTLFVCVALFPPTAPHAAHLRVGRGPNFLPPGDSFAVNLSDGKCKLLARACCVFFECFFFFFFGCSLRGQLLSFPTVLSAAGREALSWSW